MDKDLIFDVIGVDRNRLYDIRSIILSYCTDEEIRCNDVGWLLLSKGVDIMLKIEDYFKIEISDEESEGIQNLNDLIKVIQQKKS